MLASGVKPRSKKEILALVNDIEAKYPVYEWKYKGIDLWPLIRQIIFKHFLKKKVTTKKERKKLSDLKYIWNCLWKYLLLKRGLNKSDVVFSANHVHRASFDLLSYNRFGDPILDALSNNNASGILLEESKTDVYSDNIYKSERFYQMDEVLEWLNFKNRIFRKIFKTSIDLNKYQRFCADLAKLDSDLKNKLAIQRIVKLATKLFEYKNFATALLRVVQPKAVIFISYYGEWKLSLMAAAKESKIPTIDIQHGIIYPEHYSYAKYNNIPEEGLSTLPDYFWTWSKHEADLINGWCGKTIHKAVSMGNPWLMAFKEKRLPGQVNVKINPGKKLVLYSLGNRGEQFPPYFVDFIKSESDKYDFWFRLHPRQLPFKREIEQQLIQLGIFELVNIKQASELPLPFILTESSVHITLMSSVVIEAASMGVRSVILHPEGVEYYNEHEVSEFCFFFNPEKEKLGDVVANQIQHPKIKGRESNNLTLATESLKKIINF